MKKKFLSAACIALSLMMFAGCNNAESAENQNSGTTIASVTEEVGETALENQAEAEQLLVDLKGTYGQLWDVVLADEYKQFWLDNCAELMGEENAESAFEMLSSMVTGTLTGEEAAEAYKDGGMAYCCEFLQNVSEFTFDGTEISGADSNGNELFRHTYHYIGMEDVRSLYIYESDDADSGEFTYFFIAPDTMDTTWHIEFRYGSDKEALMAYDSGKYAYWLASGISVDYTQSDAENAIKLFCAENLSGAADTAAESDIGSTDKMYESADQ